MSIDGVEGSLIWDKNIHISSKNDSIKILYYTAAVEDANVAALLASVTVSGQFKWKVYELCHSFSVYNF